MMIDIDGVAPPELIDHVFDLAAQEHQPGIVVFPAIRTEDQLLDQLRTLERGERWNVSRVQVNGLATEELLVGLTWRTSDGRSSLPMGFGPFSTMPATRRAPYACLATWPGGHDNPHRKRYREHVVDFLDSALPKPLTDRQYKSMWDASVEQTTGILAEQEDSASFYRQVAFRLSSTAAARFLNLVVDDEGDDLSAEERAALHAHLEASWRSAQEGRVRPVSELLAELRARRR